MGPSLLPKFGILQSSPLMLILTLNPGLIIIGTLASNILFLSGAIGAIMNTRISLTFGLLALLFIKTNNYSKLEKTSLYAFGGLWFLLEIYSMYEAFRVIGAVQ